MHIERSDSRRETLNVEEAEKCEVGGCQAAIQVQKLSQIELRDLALGVDYSVRVVSARRSRYSNATVYESEPSAVERFRLDKGGQTTGNANIQRMSSVRRPRLCSSRIARAARHAIFAEKCLLHSSLCAPAANCRAMAIAAERENGTSSASSKSASFVLVALGVTSFVVAFGLVVWYTKR